MLDLGNVKVETRGITKNPVGYADGMFEEDGSVLYYPQQVDENMDPNKSIPLWHSRRPTGCP